MTDQTNPPALSTKGYTRRQVIACGAMGFCGLAIAGTRADAQDAATESPRAKTIIVTRAIHQEEAFKAGPQRIYEALLDAKQFTALSGGRAAEIDRSVGGAFSIFSGHIVGRNLELVPNRRIVQAWRAVSWPEGIYSIARFELLEQSSRTRIIFDHTGFPPDLAEHLDRGGTKTIGRPCRSTWDSCGRSVPKITGNGG
jgi:activator of HSP90 ATPase